MAIRTALLSFEFKGCNGELYDPRLDHEFAHSIPVQGQSIQPVIVEAFKIIKRCAAKVISGQFNFGQVYLLNVNNFVHVASATIDAEVQHGDGTCGQTATMLSCKFYRLEPDSRYKVSLELEEMPSSAASANDLDGQPDSPDAAGLNNEKLFELAQLLSEKFHLGQEVECIPVLRRGRTDKQHFLTTSDERLIEYDFNEVLFHQQSEFQDVKIISSSSLGNTLLLDNLQTMAEKDLNVYTHTIMQKGKIDYYNKRILILGGGDGALLHELLKENPKYVTMVEIDELVIEACREHMRPFGQSLCSLIGSNYQVHVDNCLDIMQRFRGENKSFDYIFNDLADIPVGKRDECHLAFQPNLAQKDKLWSYIEAVFQLAIDCLANDGRYMTHTTGGGNTATLERYENFLKRRPVKFEKCEAFVPSFMETWVFYTIRKDCSRYSRPSHHLLAAREIHHNNPYLNHEAGAPLAAMANPGGTGSDSGTNIDSGAQPAPSNRRTT